jgi:hypothetical protein
MAATRIARGAGVRVRTAASTSIPGDDTMANERKIDTRDAGDAKNDLNDKRHALLSAEERAHGVHGKGFMDEKRTDDEQATDTGDDAQLRRSGGGGDQAPDPNRFRENAAGHMGGAGWGSEQVGGSVVDRRPPEPNGDDRRHA